ncbi:MAG TPA: TIGR03621 family F420-dependent LLM class oxidoreductase [Dehalococcoidia bacterium]|nr:TIGR03621 family F420-dependent LLM class oxidoreductase [Dehalococcoidia bacterium]
MAKRKFRFGVSGRGETLQQWRDFARKAEDLGYSSLDLPDHFGRQFAPMVALVAAAQVTTRLRFATTMLCNDFRHPVMLAKEAATVDVLTDGRFELGLGTGSRPLDNAEAGMPLDPPGVRVERLRETIAILRLCFGPDEKVSFAGGHYRIEGLEAYPKPVQRPLPLMIGARGPRMLRLAAREADIVGVLEGGEGPGSSLGEKMAVIREAAGERYDQIEFSQLFFNVQVDGQPPSVGVPARGTALVGSRDQVVDQLERLREEHDISYIMVIGPVIDAFAPVVARLAGS